VLLYRQCSRKFSIRRYITVHRNSSFHSRVSMGSRGVTCNTSKVMDNSTSTLCNPRLLILFLRTHNRVLQRQRRRGRRRRIRLRLLTRWWMG
jgi:hypothetical protein